MSNNKFVFTLHTKTNITSGGVFGANGEFVGRVLSKHPKFKDEWDEMQYDGFYTYDVDSSKSDFEKIVSAEIALNLDAYSVDNCTTNWI